MENYNYEGYLEDNNFDLEDYSDIEYMSDLESSFEEDSESSIDDFDSEVKGDESTFTHTTLEVAIDSEFNEEAISLQAFVETHTTIYKKTNTNQNTIIDSKQTDFEMIIINTKYQSVCIPKFQDLKHRKRFLFWSKFESDENVLLEYLKIALIELKLEKYIFKKPIKKIKPRVIINLYFYYSLLDLTYAFGIKNMMPYYLNKKKNKLMQRRNIVGTLTFDCLVDDVQYSIDFVLKDLCGLHPGGLKELAFSVSLVKLDTMDSYKKNMEIALIQKTQEFIDYAMTDAVLLLEIFRRKVNSFNKILQIYKIPTNLHFTTKTMPLTVGSIVHQIFQKYMFVNVFNSNQLFTLIYNKSSIANQLNKNYNTTCNYLKQIAQFKNLKDLKQFELDNPDLILEMTKHFNIYKTFLYKPHQYASVNYLVSESQAIQTSYLGLTTGGRTVNERPDLQQIKYGADIDIGGAYGSQLKRIIYPMGRPRLFTYSANQLNKITLGQFMDKHQSNLTSNLYKICVSGKLTFCQDLIFSKVPPKFKNYRIQYDKEHPDDAAIDAPFILLRKEIQCGFITHKIWELINKISTAKEKNEFKNLIVESAVYWSDKDRVDTIEDLLENYAQDKGKYSFNTSLNCIVDTRSFKWFGFSLNNVIEPLTEQRIKLKKSTDEVDKALDQSIKLVINTTWGILTSPYFEINNVVCSEIVTGSIRANVWLMSKCLNTYLSITDGGPYSLMNVSFLKTPNRKPGFEVLSNYNIYSKHRNIKISSLNNINWVELFEQNVAYNQKDFKNLDQLAQKHIEDFWKNYNIKIDFNVEHKMENIFIKGSYLQKAHYAFYTYNNKTNDYSKIKYKIRGFRLDSEIPYQNPIYNLLITILKEDNLDIKYFIENNGEYQDFKLLKLNSWRKSLIQENKQLISKYGSDITPGKAIYILGLFRLNNTYFNLDTFADYRKRNQRSYRKGINGLRMILFEKYLPIYGIKITFELMFEDNLRKTINL